MKRLLAPRLLSTHALAISGIVLCLFLSSWQWSRAHVAAPIAAANGIARFDDLSPLRTYLPVASIGVRTQVSGHWQQSGAGKLSKSNRIILPNRPADGTLLAAAESGIYDAPLGSWIVDLLVLDDGSTLAVVRGWTMHPEAVPVAAGKVAVFGVMQPSEDSGMSKLPAIDLLTTSGITQHAHSAVHDGYLVARLPPHGQSLGVPSIVGTSIANSALVEVSPIIKGTVHQSLHWRNVVYTANWIVFALIVLYMWIRIVRDELASENSVEQELDSVPLHDAEPEESTTD